MDDSTIVANSVIVSGGYDVYIMKRAVVLTNNPNDDIVVIKSKLKLK